LIPLGRSRHPWQARRFITARIRGVLLPVLLVAGAGVGDAKAFGLQRTAVSGGAVGVAGGSFRLGATVGEAGVVGQTAGGGFRMVQGFWVRAGAGTSSVEAPSGPAAPPPDGPVSPNPVPAPAVNEIAGNSPNPFREQTTIRFGVARASSVSCAIHDAAGRQVRSLLRASVPAGRHQVEWDGRDDAGNRLGGGVYFARLQVDGWSASRRVLRVR
jgi:hypothetical protein